MTLTDSLPDRRRLLQVAAAACLLNILLVLALGGAGILKTTERGDITRVEATTTDDGRVELTSGSYVIEDPTDADFFYNIVVHVQNGGSLYPGNGMDPFVQLSYKYAPVMYFAFAGLSVFGYVAFKFLWLAVSLLAAIGGTYLLLAAERESGTIDLSRRAHVLLSVLAVGFQPMVTNLKGSQSTPVIFGFIALLWYWYRTDRPYLSGMAIVGATVIKPYFTAPLAIYARRDSWRGLVGYAGGFLAVNLLAVLTFGTGTLVEYYSILLDFVLKESEQVPLNSFDNWTSSQFRPFYWLGPLSTPVRLVLALPAAYLTGLHALEREHNPVELFALSLVSLMLVLETTTAEGLAALLAAFVILGAQFYERDEVGFAALVVAFLLVHAQPYALELLTGVGAEVIPVIANNESLVITLLPVAQPATYGVFLLLYLVFRSRRTSTVRNPSQSEVTNKI